MKSTQLISSQEILDRVDIDAAKTLTRWHQRGLIPPPEIGTHPNGRGKMAYWPAWVLNRCIKIRKLIKSGHRLDEIKRILGDNWKKEAQETRRRYRFTEASRKLEKDVAVSTLAELVWARLSPVLNRLGAKVTRVSESMDKQMFQESIITEAIELVAAGMNPVVMFDGDQLHLVPDFLVSHMLAKSARNGTAHIVVPIHKDVTDAFSDVIPELPERPTVRPVQRVQEEHDEKTNERNFCVTAPFQYEMGRRHRSRKAT